MTRSVESRFLAIVGITIFILVVPLFALFLSLATERASNELQQNLDILLAANAQALAKPLWDFDEESVEQITATIVSNGPVSRVNVKDISGGISVSMPALPKWPKNGLESITREIFYRAVEGPKSVGTITIYYSRIDMFSSLRQAEVMLIGIFMLAVVGVVGAAIVGNRLMVMKPLLKLTAAIEATRRLGSATTSTGSRMTRSGGWRAASTPCRSSSISEESETQGRAPALATDIYNPHTGHALFDRCCREPHRRQRLLAACDRLSAAKTSSARRFTSSCPPRPERDTWSARKPARSPMCWKPPLSSSAPMDP